MTTLNGTPIIESWAMTIKTQARKHKKKRTNKKWLKRYGYVESPNPQVYIVNDPINGGKKIIAHPLTAQIIKQAMERDNAFN